MVKITKITVSLIILLLFNGCVSMSPCKYCRQTKDPDIEHNETTELDNGYVKHVESKTWIYYIKE